MNRRRIIYALVLVSASIFYILYHPWFSWFLLVLLLLLIPLDLVASLPGMLTKTVILSAPPYLEKNADGVLTITTVHNKSFPVRCLVVKMRVTGDDFNANCKIICTAEPDGRSEVTIDTSRTGLTVFEIDRLLAVSLIGLLSLRIKSQSRASVLVLPPPEKPSSRVPLPRGLVLRPKPGGGFSEEHDMREYRRGDPIRSIHWKLSAKYDSLIIRQPLVPPSHSRLVHIIPWNTAEERDLVLGRLRWVYEYLSRWEMSFFVKLGNKPAIMEVTQESHLIDFLRNVLDDAAGKKIMTGPLPVRFTWVYRIDAGTAATASEKSGAIEPAVKGFAKSGVGTAAKESRRKRERR